MNKSRNNLYNKFTPQVAPPSKQEGPSMWFAFRNGEILAIPKGEQLRIPLAGSLEEWGLVAVRQQYLGQLEEIHCYAAELSDSCEAPAEMTFVGLRQTFGKMEEFHYALAGMASQIMRWDKTHQYCGLCGTATEASKTERAKRCPECKLMSYPRLAPAIIVAVRRQDEILLLRSAHFPSGMYSVLAGFVEPGETLEEAVIREVYEEAALTVANIQYFGSQPWPFPSSLMIGFTADYAGGRLKINRSEIEDAGWYKVSALPGISHKISIARSLIDAFCDI